MRYYNSRKSQVVNVSMSVSSALRTLNHYQDFVLKHGINKFFELYDEILSLLGSWPRTPECVQSFKRYYKGYQKAIALLDQLTEKVNNKSLTPDIIITVNSTNLGAIKLFPMIHHTVNDMLKLISQENHGIHRYLT